MAHRTTSELFAALGDLQSSPTDNGTVELIVRRPAPGARELLDEGELSTEQGLVGDTWKARGSRHTGDGAAEPDRQLTIMNARAIALFAGTDDRAQWAQAGDQLYLDLDLSTANIPPGTQLQLGDALVEISDKPHTGCAKFSQRFGIDAARFVNHRETAALNLRGINARVLTNGVVRAGDVAAVLRPPS